LRRALIESADISDGDLVLDTGIGTGYISELLTKQRVVGIDISPHMIAQAKGKMGGDGDDSGNNNGRQIDFVLADAHRLPFKPDIFDAVVSSFAIHEISDPQQALSEMYRVVKAGRRVAVMDAVVQKKLPQKIMLLIYHAFIELFTARYSSVEDIAKACPSEDVKVVGKIGGVVGIVSGKK
ncbi:MAG: methyltransferase domain-containing protein, partial [Methanosarcinales archaeon]|nr:methyltransferase domain-containing protein [Methanosarcinales archaeon]